MKKEAVKKEEVKIAEMSAKLPKLDKVGSDRQFNSLIVINMELLL